MKFKDIVKIIPGSVIPAGAEYSVNAKVEYDSLYLRDKKGNRIEGRQTDPGDEIAVIDIDYSTQLALIQYPGANGDIVQGYVTNNTRIINYMNPYTWHNGSSVEPAYLDVELSGNPFGTIDAYESATLLHEDEGKYYVAYDAPDRVHGGMSMLNKCGFVKYNGTAAQPFVPSEDSLLNVSFNSNVEVNKYGTSWAGRDLKYYKIGSGSNILFAGFAMHGFEDDWDHDGTALVHIANQLIEKISNTSDLHGWTVYIANCMNPDGVFEGITNDGPGRCTVGARMDMNRSFPTGYKELGNTRNYTGTAPLQAQEALALHDFIAKLHSDHINNSNQMVVLDFHGWMGFTQGNAEIGKYFDDKFGYSHISMYSDGFFTTWAESLSNTRAMLLEYPVGTRGISECDTRNYAEKTYEGIMELLAGNSGGASTNTPSGKTNGHVKSGVEYVNVRQEPNTNCTILGKLYGDNPIEIVEKVKSNDGYYWYEIKYNNGYAYLREDFVTVTGSIENINSGWKEINGKWYYYNESGVKVTAWQFIPKGNSTTEKAWFFFNDEGVMQTGWYQTAGNWHYSTSDGVMVTGWQNIPKGNTDATKAWFYFDKDGVMLTGTHTIDGKQYTFNSAGILESNVRGWQKIDGKEYYFDDNGNKTVGWKQIGDYEYYFNSDGSMQTGWHHEWQSWYYFNDDGTMRKDRWLDLNGKWYYLNNDGTMKKDQWLTQTNGQVFYFGDDGVKVTGTHTIDGKQYTFNSDGILIGEGDNQEPIGPDVSYQNIGQVHSSTGYLHFRKTAGTGGELLGQLTDKELIKVIGKTMVGDTPWYKVITDKGDAFASGDYITILTPIAINRYANVESSTTTYAHVRDLPGASDEYTIVATLQNGAAIDILEEYNPVGAEKPWYKIKYHKVSLEINDPLKGHDNETMDGVGFIRSDLINFDYPNTGMEDGWHKSLNQNWYYFVDGKALTGVWTIDDLFRAFDTNGKLLINKQEVHTEAGLAFIDEDGVATFIDQNQLIQEFAASPFEGYKNTEIFGEDKLMHIFRGNVKKILSDEKWLVSGSHSLWEKFDPLLTPEKKVFINDSQAFESDIKGNFINYGEIKVIKNDLHAWFPDEWNPQKLINILKAGLEQGIKAEYSGDEKIPNAYEIIVEYENVIIKIVQSKNTNKILTAFPLTQMVITNLEASAWFFIKKLKYKTSDEDNEPGGTETIGGETDDKDGEDEKDLE